MKFLFSALFLVFCFMHLNSFVSASVSRAKPNPQRKPGGCYEDDTGHLRAGEVKILTGKCMSAECGPDGTTSYASCGKIGINPQCHLGKEDLTKPYPECCPKMVCPNAAA